MNAVQVAALAALLVAGCRHEGDENLGLGARSDAVVDAKSLAGAGALERALDAPVAATAQDKLGASRREQSTKLTLALGDKTDTLEETWRTERDAAGDLHVVHDNSKELGVEWFVVGGALYERMRYGRFVKRDPQGNEVERARALQAGVLGGWLDALGRFAERSVVGASTVAGRPAQRVKLSLASSPGRFVDDGNPAHAWRGTMNVTALDGSVDVDEATGAVLGAKLSASYTFRRGSDDIKVELTYLSSVSDLGAVPKIAPPDDAVSSLERPRPLLDRAALLEGFVSTPTAKPSPER